jgi:hypothetical protein
MSLVVLISKYFHFNLNYPLSRFPQGGKALHCSPSPMGEGWEGGYNQYSMYTLIIYTRYSFYF